MRLPALLLATLAIVACSANGLNPAGPATPIAANAKASFNSGPDAALTPIATTFSYASGTISLVNTSGKTQDLSQIEVTFDDPDAIASVWGAPWMAWQIAQTSGHYTLRGGTSNATWANGATMTVSFTPPWQSKNVPSNVAVFAVAPPALVACAVTASESGGTISIVNSSGSAIPLRRAQLIFTYAGTIANIWGTPWMAWSAIRNVNTYTFAGGTHDATTLAPARTLTAAFSPTKGAHATAIRFKAACGNATPGPSPSPTPKPTPTPTPKPTPTPTTGPTVAPGGTEFVGFWESWSDTDSNDAFYDLKSVPASVTTTDVAFSIANDNTIAPVQNAYPLLPGAQAIHAHGGRLLLSFGGATSQFQITDVAQFVANLKAFQTANPGLYDGFDFDDEVLPWNGQQQLISVIKAVRAAFPHAVISFDAFMSGADPNVYLSTHQGEDVAILQQAGAAIDYVNVMDYDQYGWRPSTNPACTYAAGATDDCRLDVLRAFASVRMPDGSRFPAGKIVMGLMIGSADDGAIVSPSDANTYAAWVRAQGYRGVMIWDLDRDNPQSGGAGTGHPKGTYVNAISTSLGT